MPLLVYRMLERDEVTLRFLKRRLSSGFKLTVEQEKALDALQSGMSICPAPQAALASPVAKRPAEESSGRIVSLTGVKRSKYDAVLPAKKDIPIRTFPQIPLRQVALTPQHQQHKSQDQSTVTTEPRWLEITRSLDQGSDKINQSWEPLPPRRRTSDMILGE
mmetsp:Transcript_1772/g.2351  ORF Transcript_1772/g.2351 Transcript_1772/m.2351 type:complete len:162 (-) Transcript_1772:149-634(-)